MFTLPDLPYSFNALEPYIDAQTMEIHHDKHHATYVNNLNEVLAGNENLLGLEIDDLISDLSKVPEGIRTKVRNNGGGHANHTLFWRLMSPKPSKLDGKLLEAIDSAFGSLDIFKEKFSLSALGRFGSGWAWLVLKDGKLEITDTPNQDSPIMDGLTPILALDVWEHAYYLKYQNRRADYVSAWWHLVNWEKVGERFEFSLV